MSAFIDEIFRFFLDTGDDTVDNKFNDKTILPFFEKPELDPTSVEFHVFKHAVKNFALNQLSIQSKLFANIFQRETFWERRAEIVRKSEHVIKHEIMKDENDEYFIALRLDGLNNASIQETKDGIFIECYDDMLKETGLGCDVHYNIDKSKNTISIAKFVVKYSQKVFAVESSGEGNDITQVEVTEKGSDAWIYAKIVANCCYMNHHEVIVHLQDCHLFLESVEATMRDKEVGGTFSNVYTKFKSFFIFTRNINALARVTLIAKHGTIPQNFMYDYDAVTEKLHSSIATLKQRLHTYTTFNETLIAVADASKQKDDQKGANKSQLALCQAILVEIKKYVNTIYTSSLSTEMDALTTAYNKRIHGDFETEELFTLFCYQAAIGHTITNYQQYTMYQNTAYFPSKILNIKDFFTPDTMAKNDTSYKKTQERIGNQLHESVLGLHAASSVISVLQLLSTPPDSQSLLHSVIEAHKKKKAVDQDLLDLAIRIEAVSPHDTTFLKKKQIPKSISI